MLTPHDFGIVALGTTIVLIASAFSEGGLGSGLIRREQAPTRLELRTLNGIQLLITVAIAGIVVAVGLQLGEAGRVAARWPRRSPIATLQTPGRVVLSRSLRFRGIAVADLVATIANYGWSITTVALGAGVWALHLARLRGRPERR